jgi:hypothetical protein
MTLGDLPCDTEQRTDWKVAFVIDLTLVPGLGGGGFLFTFRNGVYSTAVLAEPHMWE